MLALIAKTTKRGVKRLKKSDRLNSKADKRLSLGERRGRGAF